jgi:beta-glucosidase
MNSFKLFALSLLSALTTLNYCQNSGEVCERKADSVLRLMTLDEKLGQLNLLTSDWAITGPTFRSDYLKLIKQGKLGSIFNAYTVDYNQKLQEAAVKETRLHIPLLFGYDVIHGHRTIFPIPLGQAASWDLDMIQKSDRIAAIEATAEGISWTFSPMVDISRDPRWGRVTEGAGEDTWLGSRIAVARVKGFQGESLSLDNTLLACVKHFAAYGAPEAGREYNTVDMSERSLFEWYLPPYKACVDAGVGSAMTSLSEVAGEPATASKWLLTDILRKQWKFSGFVVTDYTGVSQLIPHGVAADSAQAGELALNAGVDMDMQSSIFLEKLPILLKENKVKDDDINAAVKRILVAKFKLGLFDDPYKYCNKKREAEEIMRPEYRAFARQFVAKSCVLLKNSKQTLPFRKDIKSIAIIGPLADSREDMLGSWSGAGQKEKCVTLLEGIRNKLPKETKLYYVKGCNVNDKDKSHINEAVSSAMQSDVVILALGESRDMSGEASSRTNISIPGVQETLAEEVIKTGKPTVVALFNGRPLTIPLLDSIAPAILETWFGGTEAGNGIADVIFGDYNPSGKITMTFPRNVGQIPIYYNEKNTGRPFDPKQPDYKWTSKYIDSPFTPQYPFGYGLSYTSFRYSEIIVPKKEFAENEKITASVDVTNSGNYDGNEVVQLYVRDLVGEVTRPIKELKGFQKIFLKKGETKRVTFTILPEELSYYHLDMTYTWDPGEFEIFIGTNSAETKSVKILIK